MKVVGLTGGIAAGKSTVAAMFRDLGAVIVDADQVARDVVQPGMPALSEIVERFGKGVLLPDGTLDRERLRKLVFDDERARRDLEAITHPRIIQRIAERIREELDKGKPIAIVEAALLFETRESFLLDAVVVVTCDEETQIRRVVERSGLSREEAANIIRAQMPTKEKIRRADYLVDNSGSLLQTWKQVKEIWNKLAG